MNQSNWHGKIKLNYQFNQHKTELLSSFTQSPFKIQQSFYPEGEAICHNIILHTAGGVVGGDILDQEIILNDHSQSLITTPAANKIYRSNGKIAQQNINIRLENQTILEYLPQEMIIFNGAKYHQSNIINLHQDSTFLMWEIIRFGRTARGEIFNQGYWQSNLEIWQESTPILIDHICLQGEDDLFHSLTGLNDQPLAATLTYIGNFQKAETLTKISQLCHNSLTYGQAGVTELIKGLNCRYLGHSTTEVRAFFFKIWQILRLQYLGKNAIKLRVW